MTQEFTAEVNIVTKIPEATFRTELIVRGYGMVHWDDQGPAP